jgi:hypothetical protein
MVGLAFSVMAIALCENKIASTYLCSAKGFGNMALWDFALEGHIWCMVVSD